MDKLSIPISPKVGAVLAGSSKVVAQINTFVARLLEACVDGRLTIDEIVSLMAQVVTLAKMLFKKP